MDRGAAVVCVAVHANAPAQVAGYYSLASAAVVVDAKDDSATAFYARYDFMPFPDQPRRLFIAMKTVEQLG